MKLHGASVREFDTVKQVVKQTSDGTATSVLSGVRVAVGDEVRGAVGDVRGAVGDAMAKAKRRRRRRSV